MRYAAFYTLRIFPKKVENAMRDFKYDFHVHSCLSPCAENDMTPANIAGLASLLGLEIVALTDHNTSANCPAFFAAAKRHGIVPVGGMELTTAEDIHVICLFDTLDGAMAFDKAVAAHRIRIANRPEIFGDQLVMDEDDNIISTEPDLLINATDLDLYAAHTLCTEYGGVCHPAHIDRQSNGIVAVLGDFPEEPRFSSFELNDGASFDEYIRRFPNLKNKNFVVCSDAHRLEALSDGSNSISLPEPPEDGTSVSAFLRKALIEKLRN